MGIFAFWTHSFCGCYVQDLPGVTSQTEWGRNILFQLPQEAPIDYEEHSSDAEGDENEGDQQSSDGETISELTGFPANDANGDSSDGETISELSGFPENPTGSANSENDGDGQKLMELSENYEPSSFAQD